MERKVGRPRLGRTTPDIPTVPGAKTAPPIQIPVKSLKTKQADLTKLMDDNFCKKQAAKIFDWLQLNMPYGVYQRLYKLMEERQKFLGNR
jgi:hypothetical protein